MTLVQFHFIVMKWDITYKQDVGPFTLQKMQVVLSHTCDSFRHYSQYSYTFVFYSQTFVFDFLTIVNHVVDDIIGLHHYY